MKAAGASSEVEAWAGLSRGTTIPLPATKMPPRTTNRHTYLAFLASPPPSLQDIVILNVHGGTLSTVCKVLLAADLMASYPLALSPAIEIAERYWAPREETPGGKHTTYNPAIRAALVLCTCLAATTLPAFGILSGVVAGGSQALLAFVMPPLLTIYGKGKGQTVRHTVALWGIVLMGVVMIISAVYEAVKPGHE